MKATLTYFLGIQSPTTSAEKMVSAAGAIIGIALMFLISAWVTDYQGAMAILPSMGAAAVLLFAVPHGPLSQPWALLGGNILSAIAGVSCALVFENPYVAGGVAVGSAIAVMHVARCIHPPGGATALAAVIGGPGIHALGYGYVLMPTLLNVCVLLVIAVIFNYGFHWRRYPLGLMRYTYAAPSKANTYMPQLRHITQAIEELEVLMDVNAEQIKMIMDKAQTLLLDERISHLPIERGAFYTNAKPGSAWSVRQIIDESPHQDPKKYMLIFRTVDGNNKSSTDSCSLEEFSHWAKEKMQPVSPRKLQQDT
jgi:CBS domain-containing membrane protein